MSKPKNQIGNSRKHVSGDWKALKRATGRRRRREEKLDPENAPKRPEYKGGAA